MTSQTESIDVEIIYYGIFKIKRIVREWGSLESSTFDGQRCLDDSELDLFRKIKKPKRRGLARLDRLLRRPEGKVHYIYSGKSVMRYIKWLLYTFEVRKTTRMAKKNKAGRLGTCW